MVRGHGAGVTARVAYETDQGSSARRAQEWRCAFIRSPCGAACSLRHAATASALFANYDKCESLGLRDDEKHDLVEYLKSSPES